MSDTALNERYRCLDCEQTFNLHFFAWRHTEILAHAVEVLDAE